MLFANGTPIGIGVNLLFLIIMIAVAVMVVMKYALGVLMRSYNRRCDRDRERKLREICAKVRSTV